MHERGIFYITTGMDRYVGIYKQINLLNNNLIHHSLSVGWYPNSILMHILNKLLIGHRIRRREITAMFIACVVFQQFGRRASTDRERSFKFLRLQQHSQSQTVEVGANNLPVKANDALFLPTCPPFFSTTSIASLLARETSMRILEWKCSFPYSS